MTSRVLRGPDDIHNFYNLAGVEAIASDGDDAYDDNETTNNQPVMSRTTTKHQEINISDKDDNNKRRQRWHAIKKN